MCLLGLRVGSRLPLSGRRTQPRLARRQRVKHGAERHEMIAPRVLCQRAPSCVPQSRAQGRGHGTRMACASPARWLSDRGYYVTRSITSPCGIFHPRLCGLFWDLARYDASSARPERKVFPPTHPQRSLESRAYPSSEGRGTRGSCGRDPSVRGGGRRAVDRSALPDRPEADRITRYCRGCGTMVVPGERHQRCAHGRDLLECSGWQEELSRFAQRVSALR